MRAMYATKRTLSEGVGCCDLLDSIHPRFPRSETTQERFFFISLYLFCSFVSTPTLAHFFSLPLLSLIVSGGYSFSFIHSFDTFPPSFPAFHLSFQTKKKDNHSPHSLSLLAQTLIFSYTMQHLSSACGRSAAFFSRPVPDRCLSHRSLLQLLPSATPCTSPARGPGSLGTATTKRFLNTKPLYFSGANRHWRDQLTQEKLAMSKTLQADKKGSELLDKLGESAGGNSTVITTEGMLIRVLARPPSLPTDQHGHFRSRKDMSLCVRA